MAKKIIMSAYNETSQPSEDVLSINKISFAYDKPFFLICNYPIKDKAYFEFTVDDYYPIKAFRNVPLYVGISKEVSFGVLNSDFLIGSLYYKVETTEYDIMSKYSKQWLNNHTQPEHIYTRLPGAQDVIGVGADYENNCINIYVNGKLFYKIENKTYDEDGNVQTQFNLSSGTFYFCIWSNIYYKKILADFNENSSNESIERSKQISGTINFGTTESPYVPEGYSTMYQLYAKHVDPPEPEDDDKEDDSVIFDPTPYEGMKNVIVYVGDNEDEGITDSNSEVTILNPIDVDVYTLGLSCIEEDETYVTISDKYKFSMDAVIDEDERYFSSGSTVYVNKPIPADAKVYFEAYITEGQLKSNRIGIPISVGICDSTNNITRNSSRLDLYHYQWYHYYWREMNNSGVIEEEYVQHNHEIANVNITTSPEQGQVIGIAFNLAKNKMTVFINNVKMYSMITNRAVDRDTEEIFEIIKVYIPPDPDAEPDPYRRAYDYIFSGNQGTVYTQMDDNLFSCNNGYEYNSYYNSNSGRYEMYEVGGTKILEPVIGMQGVYTLDGVKYTKTTDPITNEITFTGEDGIVYTQISSDVVMRTNDEELFEFNELEDGSYKLVRAHSTKYLSYSDLKYSDPWHFSYCFFHDEGAFNGTVKGSVNFGQENFAATMPEGYMSLWDYYSISSRTHLIQDINCSVKINNDKTLYSHMLSSVKIINSGFKLDYSNDGINKLILNHTTITDTEDHFYDIDMNDIADFTATIARENNGYFPEEKLNSTTISFEGIVHYTITIPELEHQRIEASMNNKNIYTTTFQAPKGAFVNVRVIPDEGYDAGTLNVEKFTVTEDITLSASTATFSIYTVNILPSLHQTIEVVRIVGYDEEGRSILDENTKYSSRGTSKFTTTIKDADWFVRVIPDDGYIAGKPNSRRIRVNKDMTVYAEDAVVDYYEVTIPNTIHQVVKVRYNGVTYLSNKVKSEAVPVDPVVFEVPYNATVYITSEEVDVGYKIDGEYADHMVITEDVILPVPIIIDDICSIELDGERFDGTIEITNSTKNDNYYYIRRGDKVTITLTPADGLYVDDFILE